MTTVAGVRMKTPAHPGAFSKSEMARRIEKAFGVSMGTVMWMQDSYDVAQASHW